MKLTPASTFTLTLATAAIFAACATSNAPPGTSGEATTTGEVAGTGGAAETTTTSASTSSSGTGGTGGDSFDAGQGSGGQGGTASYLIYAHTGDTLYSLDPSVPGIPLTTIGKFDCVLKQGEPASPGKVSSMTDLAVDEDLHIWTVSAAAVHPITVTGNVAHCGQPITLTDPILMDKNKRFFALSFVPKGVLDPNKEVLVAGNTAGELWAIADDGTLTQHGTLGNIPKDDGHGHVYPNYDASKTRAWEISGDIAFLSNNGKPVGFVTVRDCPNPPSSTGCNLVDTLLEIDMTKLVQVGKQSVKKSLRGQILKRPGCNDAANASYGYLYGIATWNDKVYGFGREGNLVDISLADGSACLVKNYPASMFSGAAVTTLAPVVPPPN